MEAVNEMLFHESISYTTDEIMDSVGRRFRKTSIQTVYDFLLIFDDDCTEVRYVLASSEEEAIATLESHYRKLQEQGFLTPRFISNPTIHVDYVIT
jgi:hypothetical protein